MLRKFNKKVRIQIDPGSCSREVVHHDGEGYVEALVTLSFKKLNVSLFTTLIENFNEEILQSSLVFPDRPSEIPRSDDNDIVSASSLSFGTESDSLASGPCPCPCCDGNMGETILVEGFTRGSDETRTLLVR